MDLIQEILKGTKDAESPSSYFYWSTLAAISAVVKDNVYIDRYLFKRFKLYPNIYVILVGPSGIKKGVPLWLAQELVEGVNNTRVIAGKTTIPGILSDLSKVYTRENAPPINDAAAFLLASEFASFLVENPKDALTDLTTLYDRQYNNNWKYNIKSEPLNLKNICVTMLAASNETHLKDAMPPNAHSGGFLARTFLVVEKKKKKSNPLTRAPDDSLSLEPLIERLKCISKLKGAFSYTTSSMELYEEWYRKHDERAAKDVTGTENRLGDSILKTAMLISLARRDTLVMEETDMEDAINSCGGFIKAAHQTTMGQGKSDISPQLALVLKEVYEAEGYCKSKKKILRENYGDIDTMTFDRVADTLEQAGIIKLHLANNETMLTLTKKGINVVEATLEEED